MHIGCLQYLLQQEAYAAVDVSLDNYGLDLGLIISYLFSFLQLSLLATVGSTMDLFRNNQSQT